MIQPTLQNNMPALIEDMMAIQGAQAAAIVDMQSGTCIREKEADVSERGSAGRAATMSTETLRTMTRLGRMMADTDNLEDMVATFHGHYHIVRPLQGEFLSGLFLLLVLERNQNSDALAAARFQLMHIAFGLSLLEDEREAAMPWDRFSNTGLQDVISRHSAEQANHSLHLTAL